MCDFEYLFSTELHRKLKEKLFGKIWVKVYRNELHVTITSDGGVEYEFVKDNFDKRVLNGISSDSVVCEVIKEYRRFITDRYFRREA